MSSASTIALFEKQPELESATDPTDSTCEHPASLFRSGVFMAIAGTFLFALKSIFIKLAYASGADATLLLTLRLALALPFYVVVFVTLQRSESRRPLHTQHIVKAIVLGFLGYYLASFLDLWGLEYISAQLERLTLFTYPAIIAVLAWLFLGEQVGPRVIGAIVLCYFGVWMMYGQEVAVATASSTDSSQTTWGVILVTGAAISFSVYVLFAKPTMQKIGSREFTSLAMMGSTVCMIIHFFIARSGTDLISASPIVYAYGIILAFVCTVIPSFMINEAIVRIGATRTSVIGTIGPVLTMGLAILILSEPSSVQHFLGMLAAVLGVSLVAKR